MDETEFPAPVASGKRRAVRYGAQTARVVLARTAAGESLRAICGDPGMPAPHTVLAWQRERPGFAAALLAARQAAGGPFVGGRSTYCRETAEAIFARLCAGESITRICQDPAMPVAATVYKWRRDIAEFDTALKLARDIQADRFFDLGWEMCEAATPETAFLTKVRLGHLRWQAGCMAPRKYGTRPEPAVGDGEGGFKVVIRRFTDAPLSADDQLMLED